MIEVAARLGGGVLLEPLGARDPRRIGPYRLRRRLGAGGMGQVFLGVARDGEPVAVKVVHPGLAQDERFRERFRREVEVSRRVTGPWVAGAKSPTRPLTASGPAAPRGAQSASKIGSSTSLAAVCTTRSRIVGMPSGRSPPPGFGIITRRTGAGRYVLATRSFLMPASHSSNPAASIAAKLIPSTPDAPPLVRASA